MLLTEILSDPSVQAQFNAAPLNDRIAYIAHAKWVASAHKYQIPPPLEQDYTVWMMLAGRGAGKTRSAAEALWWWAWTTAGSRCLVLAPTSGDVKFTCFEGESGLLACIPPELIVDYNKQDHQIKLSNGSIIRGISADSYERLRGPQFHFAWCCIAGTRILMADGAEKPVEAVEAGDKVMTQHGVRNVTASGVSHNPNDLAVIEIGDTRLTLTVDHPILVGDQWIPAGNIKEGDLLWVTSTSGADTRTVSFMSATTGQYLVVGSFITSMATKATTALTILWQCLKQTISRITPKASLRLRPKRQVLDNQSLLAAFRLMLPASIAVDILSPQRLARLESSAQNRVLNHGETTSFFTSKETAPCVTQNTPPLSLSSGIAQSGATPSQLPEHIELTQQAVKSVGRLPNCVTYNLTVDDVHEYIANGVVVHNCDELAAFQYIQDAWDMMMFGLRLGESPRVIVTTTPKPKDLILDLVGREGEDVIIDRASTYQNADNLAPTFKSQLEQYKGSKLYQQEVLGELVDLEDGKVVNREMFKLWGAGKPFPKFEFIVQSYDCAFSDKEYNDPTAMTTWGVFKPLDGPMSVLLIDCWAEHLNFPKLKPKVLSEWRVSYGDGKDAKRPDLILVEDKAAGISLIQELRAAHLPVRGYNPGKADKMQRLQITASIFATGRVWLPESNVRKGYVKDWAEGFLSQLCSFPDSTHDDYVDSATQAIRLLKDMGFLDINPQPQYDDDDYVYTRKERVNPYAV